MENYYKSKFELLNEQLKKERELSKLRESSQTKWVFKIKNQIRDTYESELRIMQEQMYRENEFLLNKQPLKLSRLSRKASSTKMCN